LIDTPVPFIFKDQMIQLLTGLAMGIVIFAVTIGVGLVTLVKFADTQAVCASGFEYNATVGVRTCQNATNISETATPTGTAYTTLGTLQGSTNGLGALVTWVGAIIALLIGVAFIGLLMGKKQY